MGKPKVEEQKPTAQELAQFAIAKEKWANYQDNGVPLQDRYIDMLTNDKLNADGSVRTDAGQAVARAQQQWQPLLSRAVNPNTGRGRTGMVPMLAKKMASDANIEAGTRFSQQGGYLQGLADVAAMGRGQVAGTLNSMQSLAGQAAQVANADALDAYKDNVADQRAAQGLLGLGATAALRDVNPYRSDGTYIKGAYDRALPGLLSSFGRPAGQSYGLNQVSGGSGYAGLLGRF